MGSSGALVHTSPRSKAATLQNTGKLSTTRLPCHQVSSAGELSISTWNFSGGTSAALAAASIHTRRRIRSSSSTSSEATMTGSPLRAGLPLLNQVEVVEIFDDNFADADLAVPENYIGDVPVIDIDDQIEQYLDEILEIRQPTENSKLPHSARQSSSIAIRNPVITHPNVLVDEVLLPSNIKLRPGKTVELMDGSFMLVSKIIQNQRTRDIAIRGYTIERMRDLNGVFAKKQNEVCGIIHVDSDDPRPISEQSLKQVSVSEIVRFRRLNVTNNAFPANTYRNKESSKVDMAAEEEGELAMRFILKSTFPSARARHNNAQAERAAEHLLEFHVAEFGKPKIGCDERRRRLWRGKTVPGGSGISPPLPTNNISILERAKIEIAINLDEDMEIDAPHAVTHRDSRSNRRGEVRDEGVCRQLSVISLEEVHSTTALTIAPGSMPRHNILGNLPISISPYASDLSTPPKDGFIISDSGKVLRPRLKGQRYTYGDACRLSLSPYIHRLIIIVAGVGGTTRGAYMAGLLIKYGFDSDEHAALSWTTNFPLAIMYREDAHDIVRWSDANSRLQVDVLHMSPPCQFFSPAHTVVGVNDEANFSIIFSCGDILKAAKPRMGTLEQTFGIMHAVFRQVFNTIVCMMTSLGYSVRWKIAPLQDWGLPQRRHRLIMFFSGPGDPLPEFPAFTHAAHPIRGDGMKKHRSVYDAIASIPSGQPHHNLRQVTARQLQPWDGNAIAPRAMTTSGGQNYHPSGKRDFTNAEFAALQGFPLEHKFCGNYVKKQIGNAVPPLVAKLWFEKIIKTLEKVDKIEPVKGVDGNVIVIEDDDDHVGGGTLEYETKPEGVIDLDAKDEVKDIEVQEVELIDLC